MKLLNVHVVRHDQGAGVYVLGKLSCIIDSAEGWENILTDNVVHISRIYLAYNDTTIDSRGFPNTLSEVTFDT